MTPETEPIINPHEEELRRLIRGPYEIDDDALELLIDAALDWERRNAKEKAV